MTNTVDDIDAEIDRVTAHLDRGCSVEEGYRLHARLRSAGKTISDPGEGLDPARVAFVRYRLSEVTKRLLTEVFHLSPDSPPHRPPRTKT